MPEPGGVAGDGQDHDARAGDRGAAPEPIRAAAEAPEWTGRRTGYRRAAPRDSG
jgi:hypothetical protein